MLAAVAGMLPTVDTELPVEPYAPPLQPTGCDPDEKPGVVLFRDFVMRHLGGRDAGIVRGCGAGHSEHYEGRAWDWGMRADNPEQSARVAELIDWLLAPDVRSSEPHANFRRVGLRYLIWNKKIWSPGKKTWSNYTGPNPHTDHVHLSWDWPGAMGETSFYRWLGGGSHPLPVAPAGWGAPALALGVGVAIGWFAAR